MHPVLRDWRWLLAWILAWGAVGGLLATVAGEPQPGFAMAAVMGLGCLAPWSMCRVLPFRTRLPYRAVIAHFIAAVVVTGASLLAGEAITAHPQRFDHAAPSLCAIVFALYLMVVALNQAALEVEMSRRSELLARDAQLRALKSQVNPHFLFNSLNSISALAGSDAGRARDMCVRLADFLRTSLKLGERSAITIEEELELTRMYLSVEQTRFGSRLKLEESVDPACGPYEIPALSIQPLVENAVKHGVAMMAEGGVIRLSGTLTAGQVRLTIENDFDPDAPKQQRNGIGLKNVRERLEARYGGHAELRIDAGESHYRVTMILPARTA